MSQCHIVANNLDMTSFCRVLHRVRVAASLRKCFHQSFQWLPSSRSSTVPQTFSLLPGNIKPVQAHAYNALCQYAYLQRLPIHKAKLFKVIGCKHIFWFLWSSSEQCASTVLLLVVTSTTISGSCSRIKISWRPPAWHSYFHTAEFSSTNSAQTTSENAKSCFLI